MYKEILLNLPTYLLACPLQYQFLLRLPCLCLLLDKDLSGWWLEMWQSVEEGIILGIKISLENMP